MAESVSVLGLGRMGSALARAFARADHEVTVWNRSPNRAEPLRRLGVAVSDSLQSACQASEVTVMCVADYAVVRALLTDEDAVAGLRGRTLVQLTSGTPRDGRALGEWASTRDVGHVEGKIISYPEAIGTSDAALLYAGASPVFEAARPVLSALGGDPVYLGDDVGHPAALDASLLTVVMGAYVANMVGRALCEREGISPNAWGLFAELLLTGAPKLVADLNARLDRGDVAGDQATLATWAHGAELLHADLVEAGIDSSLSGCIAGLVRQGLGRGHAEDDFAALYQIVKGKGGDGNPVSATAT